MGLLESEMQPAIKKILDQPKEKIEEFLKALALVLDRQQAAIGYITWTEDAKKYAKDSNDAVIEFLKKMRE